MDVEVVGDLTAEELRAAELARLDGRVDVVPPLGPREFTRADAMERWGWNGSKAERELEALVAAGTLRKAWRYDPRTKRRAIGYRLQS